MGIVVQSDNRKMSPLRDSETPREEICQQGVCRRAEDRRGMTTGGREPKKSKKSYLRQSKLKIYSPERSRRRFALPSVDFVDDARKEFVRLKAAGDYCTVVCSHIVRMDSREFVHARLEKQHKRSVDPLSSWQGETTQGLLSRVETRKVHRA